MDDLHHQSSFSPNPTLLKSFQGTPQGARIQGSRLTVHGSFPSFSPSFTPHSDSSWGIRSCHCPSLRLPTTPESDRTPGPRLHTGSVDRSRSRGYRGSGVDSGTYCRTGAVGGRGRGTSYSRDAPPTRPRSSDGWTPSHTGSGCCVTLSTGPGAGRGQGVRVEECVWGGTGDRRCPVEPMSSLVDTAP